ncbi:MAG: aldo/keto reductase [Burkholderiales bacterium]|nr:aldo/keto reductase [Burkholderiales bacterium]
MQFTRLGRSGLSVSRICLGCMTYGMPERGNHPWTIGEEASRPLIRQAVEAGINFFDTANIYSDGTSEEIVGRALREFARRDEIVVATKGRFANRRGPNLGGLSRKALFQQIDDSLARLGMDHVDLYQIHRADPATPIEETMEALHDIVKAGKARYIGASSMFAWQFVKAQHVAERNGWTRFVSMQPEWSLLYREEEREMVPLCLDQGVGVIPWSPLARGRLARPWGEATPRIATDTFGAELFKRTEEADRRVAEALATVSAARDAPRAQVALAWLLAQPGVTAPIVGASKPGQLDDAIAALALTLTDDEIKALEAPYVPHAVVGFE